MAKLTDRALRKLLLEPNGMHSDIERMSDKHLTAFAIDMARELLATRKVVRAAKKLIRSGCRVAEWRELTAALDAYAKRRQ